MELEEYVVTQEDIDFINSFEDKPSPEQLELDEFLNTIEDLERVRREINKILNDFKSFIPVDFEITNSYKGE